MPTPHLRLIARPSASVEARLDLQRLDDTVERYFRNGLAGSTRKAYDSAKRRYTEFAAKHGRQPLPASEHQLCQLVCYLAESKLCHSTIKCYLSAIRRMHIAEGYRDPHITPGTGPKGYKVPPGQGRWTKETGSPPNNP